MVIAFLFILMCIMAVGFITVRRNEKKDWNHGYCSMCGNKWIEYDMDSQGGRGYKCSSGKHSIWITYNVDKVA